MESKGFPKLKMYGSKMKALKMAVKADT